ncbi:MAG: CHASE2 domain-containing protein [Anaerolineae bacterium]|nr:CHASE2 domain-containing protein [Gloeobacterales cyanobacterium ES-bin-313]
MEFASGLSNRWLGLIVGLVWGVLWSLFIPLTPLVSLDLQSRDWFARLQPRAAAPKEIAIVGISSQTNYVLPATYASLIERILGQGRAKVVLLSLPNEYSRPAGNDYYDPLKRAIARYKDRLVLEGVPTSQGLERSVDIFSNLLPFDNRELAYSVDPSQIVGIREFLRDPDEIVRRTQLQNNLKRSDSGIFETFYSADFLAVRQYAGHSPRLLNGQDRLYLFESDRDFANIPFKTLCPLQKDLEDRCGKLADPKILAGLRDHIVLVGNVGDHPDALIVNTMIGPMNAVALHGNIIAGLLTGRRWQYLPQGLEILLVFGFSLVSGLALGMRRRSISIALVLGYVALTFGAAVQPSGLLLPIVPSLAAFVFIGNTLFYFRRSEATRLRLAAQEAELERLRRAEREAILNQAKKLLYRVATDIHDRPLQELKLVMDQLEDQLIDLPTESALAIALDRCIVELQEVGRSIRLELNDLRTVAAKLEITPTLKAGLHAGIETELDRLIANADLQLRVERHISPLIEPTADSQWLDAREDLFRFFKEVITNVLRHAQPKGATWVAIALTQTGLQATLKIENDGPPLGVASTSGGYGTKVLNTIAKELPDGNWERQERKEGGVTVTLHWNMPPSR